MTRTQDETRTEQVKQDINQSVKSEGRATRDGNLVDLEIYDGGLFDFDYFASQYDFTVELVHIRHTQDNTTLITMRVGE